MIALLLATQAVFWPWAHWLTSPLLDVPVPFDRTVAIERNLRVPIGEPYQLSLMFPRRGVHADPRDLLDLPPSCGGGTGSILLPLQWSLTTMDGASAASGDGVRPLCAGSWSSDFVWAALDDVRVPPGRYRLRATLGPWPAAGQALAGTQPRLLLAMHGGKAWSGWQLSVVFWGSLASVYVVWPLLALLGLAWLWRRVLSRR